MKTCDSQQSFQPTPEQQSRRGWQRKEQPNDPDIESPNLSHQMLRKVRIWYSHATSTLTMEAWNYSTTTRPNYSWRQSKGKGKGTPDDVTVTWCHLFTDIFTPWVNYGMGFLKFARGWSSLKEILLFDLKLAFGKYFLEMFLSYPLSLMNYLSHVTCHANFFTI